MGKLQRLPCSLALQGIKEQLSVCNNQDWIVLKQPFLTVDGVEGVQENGEKTGFIGAGIDLLLGFLTASPVPWVLDL